MTRTKTKSNKRKERRFDSPIFLLSFLWDIIQPFRLWVLSIATVSLFRAIDLSLRPYIMKIIVDTMNTIPPLHAITALWPAALGYLGLSLFMILIFRWHSVAWMRFNAPLKKHVGLLLMKRMMRHSHPFHQSRSSGNQAGKLQDIITHLPDLVKILADDFLAQTLCLLIAVFTLWTVHYTLALTLTIWSVFYIIATLYTTPKLRTLTHRYFESRSSVLGIIVDLLSNMVNVRFFTGAHQEQKNLNKGLTTLIERSQKRDWFLFKIFFMQGLSYLFYQGLALYWIITGFQAGTISAGDCALVLALNVEISSKMWDLSGQFSRFVDLWGAAIQGFSLVYSPIDIKDKKNAPPLHVTKGAITFNKVRFHYHGQEPLFHNSSVTIKPGQKVGLVGYSGGGKTTFINLILRLFDIEDGAITIDGQDIRDVTQDSLRAQISVIPQNPILFHRSLEENIRYGRHDASIKSIISASKKAYAHDFIKKMPNKYKTMVGERGLRLSGGQRQRIAIARAILKNAPILILDEATSELDSVTEQEIQASLATLMQGKTTLVIAHRLSTLMSMDRILVFEQGNIVGDGTHESLLKTAPLYKKLWKAQVGSFLAQEEGGESLRLSLDTPD